MQSRSLIESVERDIIDILIKTINFMNAGDLIKRVVRREDSKVIIRGRYRFKVGSRNRLYVIGFGKASGAMAEAIEELLTDMITEGFVIIPRGLKRRYHTRRIKLYEAIHPLPSEANITSAMKVLDIVREAGKDDIIIALISGGGSSLLTLPRPGITLDDVRIITELLMKAGGFSRLKLSRVYLK